MGGFPIYRPKDLAKVNAIRRTLTQPDVYTVPTLTKGQVLFVSAASMHNEPASCANCIFHNTPAKSCQLIGPHIIIAKLTYPKEATSNAKPIEYWPCCSMHTYGDSNDGAERFLTTSDPTDLGLIWINAPRVGQAHGGANCGGTAGGDDCDHYMTSSDDKRSEPSAFCRVLQCEVNNGDVCAAWWDDDHVDWQRAQVLLAEAK